MLVFHSLGSRWNALLKLEPAAFKSSAGMPSEPGLLLFFSLWMAVSTSDIVGGGTSSVLWKWKESSLWGVRWKTLPIDRGFPACWWWGCHFYHYRQMKLVQNLCAVGWHFDKIFSPHFCPSRSPSLPCSSCQIYVSFVYIILKPLSFNSILLQTCTCFSLQPLVIGFVLSSYIRIVFCISSALGPRAFLLAQNFGSNFS